ncbi:hypothetical protein GCM10022382_12700 [Microbacterium invictum]
MIVDDHRDIVRDKFYLLRCFVNPNIRGCRSDGWRLPRRADEAHRHCECGAGHEWA